MEELAPRFIKFDDARIKQQQSLEKLVNEDVYYIFENIHDAIDTGRDIFSVSYQLKYPHLRDSIKMHEYEYPCIIISKTGKLSFRNDRRYNSTIALPMVFTKCDFDS